MRRQGDTTSLKWESGFMATDLTGSFGTPMIDDATNKDQLVCRFTFATSRGKASGLGVLNLRDQTIAFHPQ